MERGGNDLLHIHIDATTASSNAAAPSARLVLATHPKKTLRQRRGRAEGVVLVNVVGAIVLVRLNLLLLRLATALSAASSASSLLCLDYADIRFFESVVATAVPPPPAAAAAAAVAAVEEEEVTK